MYQNLRLELRLNSRDLYVLDQRRGNVSRSRYLRWLIHNHPHPEPHPDPLDPPIPSPIHPPVPPPNPVETSTF